MSGRPTLLVVDDDADMAALLAALAEGAGFTAHAADGAVQVAESLRAGLPAVIILDMVMPWPSGMEVLSALRDQGWAGHLVIATGDHRMAVEAAEFAATLGLAGITTLLKPFDPVAAMALLKDLREVAPA